MRLILEGFGQGARAYAACAFPKATVIFDYQERVREELKRGLDPLEEAARMKERADWTNLVILTQEIGCGIVPLDAFERKWREVNGRVNCYFAKEAEEVVRVTAGIGQRIK